MRSIWSLLTIIVLLVVLGLYSWRRGRTPGARPFAIGCLLGALVLAGTTAELAAATVPAKLAWYKFQAVLLMPTVSVMTCFALDYTYPGRWLTRRNLALLFCPSVLTLAAILTDDLHHSYFAELVVADRVRSVLGVAGWAATACGVGLLVINIAAFAWLFIRSPQHRWPVALIVIAQLGSRALFVLDMAAGWSPMGLDLFVASLVLPYGVYTIALFGFRILDPLPAARRMVIEQMEAGVVVFDADWRVVSLNPAAETILGLRSGWARGKSWRDLPLSGGPWPALPDVTADYGESAQLPEMTIDRVGDARHYSLAVSPLRDHRRVIIGYLLLLHDVTDQRRAQKQVLERQWEQATLQERELLAQELHDGLAQDLGFLNMQAQAACLYLRSGQADAAQHSLDRLSEVALETQGDTRELIGDLLTVSLPSEGLCSALRQAVARFERQNDLPVRLEIGGDVDGVCTSAALPPAAGVQLLRIVQEALANVRQHADSPGQIDVRLAAEDGHLRVTIADDGQGFDMSSSGAEGRHFGLSVMSQRAVRIGGQLMVHSAPGQGTRVEASVPLASHHTVQDPHGLPHSSRSAPSEGRSR